LAAEGHLLVLTPWGLHGVPSLLVVLSPHQLRMTQEM